MSRIFKIYFDVHMGLSHRGLGEMAMKSKVNLDLLEDGDVLMFLNKKGDKMKVLGARGMVIGYLRMPENRPIMREALKYIPSAFGGPSFNYETACLKALQRRFSKYEPNEETP